MVGAWIAHFYTATGAVCAFLAISRVFYDRYQEGFFWLFLAFVVDATDGVLARRVNVSGRLPWFDGAKLDDIVDYLTYVFVPVFFVWHALLVPDRGSVPIAVAMLVSSLYGFNRADAKTKDHFFTGFPSCWNIVVFYLYVAEWPRVVNAAILLACAALVFVPLHYVYPSRTPIWRTLTMALGVIWSVLMVSMLWQMPSVARPIFWASLLFPLYYVVLSLALDAQRRKAAQSL